MTFFNPKIDEYLNTLSVAEQIDFLQGYANDAGTDGEWHKQREILDRINAIKDANQDEAKAYEEAKKSAHDKAIKASIERGDKLIERGF
ncbi:MAG: hypothetical protein ACWGQW_01955 [bacterium]